MVIWGGNHTSIHSLATGGRYDPATDLWSPMTTVDAPSARVTHSMVWTGTHAIVWGGTGGESTGGRYVIFDPPDGDGDGFTVCTGDCDESDPLVHAGADEACDGKDSDCDGGLPAEEADADADGFRACGGDCDDTSPLVNPDGIDLPGNTLDEDCDGFLLCDPAAPWNNRGQFIACVARACRTLVEEGSQTPGQCAALISRAARLSLR
jgi:hypothetical protein